MTPDQLEQIALTGAWVIGAAMALVIGCIIIAALLYPHPIDHASADQPRLPRPPRK